MLLRQDCKKDRPLAYFVPPRAQLVWILTRAVERIEVRARIAAHVNITSKGRAARSTMLVRSIGPDPVDASGCSWLVKH
jgi:hypothetical protein